MIPALLALACAGGVAGYSVALGGPYSAATEGLAAVGLAVLALGLVVRLPSGIGWSVAALAAAYVIARSGAATVDGWAVVVGVGLLATAETGFWSLEHDARIHEERAVLVRRAATLAALVVGALLLDALVVAAAAVSGGRGLLLSGIGVAAAVTAVAVIQRLVRET